jgi:NAD(P)H-hydrate epimerase
MFRGVDSAQDLGPLIARTDVMAVGPGLGTGDWGRTLLDAALMVPRPLLLDADALNLLAQQPFQRDHWVLTPHPGEAAHLLGIDTATVQADRFAAGQQLTKRYGGVVVLKGAGSLVATAGQTPQVITAGNPGMASGGMGDVLTGIIASLIAQGLPLFAAARLGVWLHAQAADQAAAAGERGLLASDLMPYLRNLVNP